MSISINKENILRALSTVPDPDLGKDLVTLKMIKDVEVNGKSIQFTVVLTTPACPLKDKIKEDCINAIYQVVGTDVKISINMTARVTENKLPTEVLPGVKNIIAVASGKGGVGKSTVSVNLAVGLAKSGAKVGLIDADIHGPSIPLMMGLVGQKPKVKKVGEKHILTPLVAHGVKTLSFGFLVPEGQAVIWRGPMISSAFRQFITDCDWGELDYMIIDLPPGTGDIHLTLSQTLSITGAVVVTTPQAVAISDARKALGMFQNDKINTPVLGIIENMAYFTPEELPNNKYYIFGKGGGIKLAQEYNVPLLGQIPLVQGVSESGDAGTPIVLNESSLSGKLFFEAAERLAQQIAIENAKPKVKETTINQ